MKICKSYVFSLMAFVTLLFIVTGNCYAAPDLNKWVGTWFKITHTIKGYHYADIDVKPSPSRQIRDKSQYYMKITAWDNVSEILQIIAYRKENGVWDLNNFIPMDLSYFAGDSLEFVGETFTEEENLVLRFKGKLNAKGNFKLGGNSSVKSLGGIYLDIASVPGTERWVGLPAVKGSMIPVSKVPGVLLQP